MNKQLTKKTIGIAASAALMAAALSATAVAGPDNPNKGPKASIKVAAWCDVDVNYDGDAFLNVHTLVRDSGGPVQAVLLVDKNSIQAYEGVGNNRKGEKFSPLSAIVDGIDLGKLENVPSVIGDIQHHEPINLCEAGMDPAANSANALVTVEIVNGHKIFTAMCGNHDLAT
jgi:hypothetical protein